MVIEVNPFSTHGHRRAHTKDTRKITDLSARGYTVLGFTDYELTDKPFYVAATISKALATAKAA